MHADVATRSGRLTVGLLVALVAVLAFGSVGAIAIGRGQRQTAGVAAPDTTTSLSSKPGRSTAPASAQVLATRAVRPTHQSSSPDAKSASSAPAPSASDTTVTVPDSDPTSIVAGPSNNMTVQMSPATRAHARSLELQQTLQGYFDAINQHDYPSWTQSVTTTLVSHQSREQWLQAYATTVDSGIWMQSIRDDPLQVQIRFTSQQDPDLAPKDMPVGCIHWRITYQMADQAGRLSVGSTVEGSVDYAKC